MLCVMHSKRYLNAPLTLLILHQKHLLGPPTCSNGQTHTKMQVVVGHVRKQQGDVVGRCAAGRMKDNSAAGDGKEYPDRADHGKDLIVFADRVRFKQILYNLLSNAVKFTPNTGRVDIDCCESGKLVCIAVADRVSASEPRTRRLSSRSFARSRARPGPSRKAPAWVWRFLNSSAKSDKNLHGENLRIL